jgi:hypothetical protein
MKKYRISDLARLGISECEDESECGCIEELAEVSVEDTKSDRGHNYRKLVAVNRHSVEEYLSEH